MGDADRPDSGGTSREKPPKQTVRQPRPSAQGNLDKTIQESAASTPSRSSTAPKKSPSQGNLDKTIQDPAAAPTVLKAPPPPPPPKGGMKASAGKGNVEKTIQDAGRKSTKGNYQMTITDAASVGDLAKTIQDNWGGTIIDVQNVSLSLKSQGQGARSASTRVSVKSRVLTQAPEEGTAARAVSPRGAPSADYELIEVLGEGGMGVVYTARQTSVDRTIAVKMIKGEAAEQESSRNKFLAEAAVTADLDHPNIVPVYDLGTNEQGAIFYAMKKVKGKAWCDVVREKELPENIEILLRVCDAVAFAHDKGVVHRDLKPENVMLGDYGEALVMDWGLAGAISPSAKADAISANNACCGTPCYMAPEMALGLAPRIGKHSDIYLLGAILYEVVTGIPPHGGEDVMSCLMNAGMNQIQSSPMQGELVDIALKAMATEPEDRYGSVQEFKQAIRDYQEHFESTTLSSKAQERMEKALESGEYNDFAQALYGFQEAISLWGGNEEARTGEREVRLLYAQCAADKEDLDLAASLLLEDEPSHQDLRKEVAKALKAQKARQRRLKMMTYGTYGGVVLIILILTVASIIIGLKMREAQLAEADATTQRDAAEEAKKAAEKNELLAKENEKRAAENAQTAKKEEERAKNALGLAEERRKQAEAAEKDATEKGELAKKEAERANQALERVKQEQAAREKAEASIKYKLRIQENTWWVFDAGKAQEFQQAEATALGIPATAVIKLPQDRSLEFVLVPVQAPLAGREAGSGFTGQFGMGSSFDETDRDGEEYLHEVKFTRPFYLGKCELTRGQWQALLGDLPAETPKGDDYTDAHPITHASWEQVKEKLIPALQKLAPAGYTVRLPTEAEWEYACRAGSNTPFSAGGVEALAQAAWTRANSQRHTQPVGQKAPNPWGLYDMHGNVAEFCEDVYDQKYYRRDMEAAVIDPCNTAGDADRRVFRGGGWISIEAQCRSAYRSWMHCKNAHEYIGVRLVLEPPAK